MQVTGKVTNHLAVVAQGSSPLDIEAVCLHRSAESSAGVDYGVMHSGPMWPLGLAAFVFKQRPTGSHVCIFDSSAGRKRRYAAPNAPMTQPPAEVSLLSFPGRALCVVTKPVEKECWTTIV